METLTDAFFERFTLHAGQWYSAEIIGDEFGEELRSYSPIRIDSIVSSGTERRQFTVSFYHANYPEGARDKVYTLQTIERAARYLLARSITHSPARLFLISNVSWDWMRANFSTTCPVNSQDIQRWLSKHV